MCTLLGGSFFLIKEGYSFICLICECLWMYPRVSVWYVCLCAHTKAKRGHFVSSPIRLPQFLWGSIFPWTWGFLFSQLGWKDASSSESPALSSFRAGTTGMFRMPALLHGAGIWALPHEAVQQVFSTPELSLQAWVRFLYEAMLSYHWGCCVILLYPC